MWKCLLPLVLILGSAAYSAAAIVVVDQDAWLASDYTGDIGWSLGVGRGSANNWTRTYLQFQLPTRVPGAVVASAILKGYYYSDWAEGIDTTHSWLLAASDSWSKSTITWANQPGPSGAAIASFVPASTPKGWVSWDITAVTNQEYNTDGVLSLVLKEDNEGATLNGLEYFSAKAQNPQFAFQIDLDIQNSSTVPEPVSLIIWTVLGAGAAGFAMRRREKAGRWSAEDRQAIYAMLDGKLRH
jgi:hypothetical protein